MRLKIGDSFIASPSLDHMVSVAEVLLPYDFLLVDVSVESYLLFALLYTARYVQSYDVSKPDISSVGPGWAFYQ